jgi:hypothetical protein
VGGDGELVRGREAAGRLAWADAYAALSLADQSSSLAAEDLELLATAAYLLGHVEDCLGALQRAQQLHSEAGESRRAARCAFWLAFHLGSAGEPAQAGGWLARANRLLSTSRRTAPSAACCCCRWRCSTSWPMTTRQHRRTSAVGGTSTTLPSRDRRELAAHRPRPTFTHPSGLQAVSGGVTPPRHD